MGIRVDEQTLLPDGTVLEPDDLDDLDEAQRRALNASISMSLQQAARGETAPAAVVLERLRARRHG